MDGQSYYWSKKNPRLSQFTDLVYGNASCYAGYDGVDRHDYSTFLYRDKAVAVIERHDYEASPMFLYLAMQAVHDPFYDFDNFESGIPKSYLAEDMYAQIVSDVSGRKRRQYAMALRLMDEAVESVYTALDEQGQLENTYVIFTSDNGGCYGGGGKNGEYRGAKGSLWEGGTKVDAFVYSPLLDSSLQGSQYQGLMHVSDWMPTILDMANVGFVPAEGYELDGVSHWGHLNREAQEEEEEEEYPREYLLYNYIIDVGGKDFSLDSNAPVAVRNQAGMKLIHSYVGNPSSEYYAYDDKLDDDSTMNLRWECTQSDSMTGGVYKTMLFDLAKDPYETTDLYDDADYADVKAELYEQIEAAYAGHAFCSGDGAAKSNKEQRKVWKDAGDYIVPWAEVEAEQRELHGYASYCASPDHTLAPSYDRPTAEPTHKPSRHPTELPTFQPSEEPTPKPSKADSTAKPTKKPSREPTFQPSEEPSLVPSLQPSLAPSYEPSLEPSLAPSLEPTPTLDAPTLRHTSPPTPSLLLNRPTAAPTAVVDEPPVLLSAPPSPSTMLSMPPSPSAMYHEPQAGPPA